MKTHDGKLCLSGCREPGSIHERQLIAVQGRFTADWLGEETYDRPAGRGGGSAQFDMWPPEMALPQQAAGPPQEPGTPGQRPSVHNAATVL